MNLIRLQCFVYMDDDERKPDPDEFYLYNPTTHLIEIRRNNQILELVPASVIRCMIPVQAPSPPRICPRCRRPSSTTPCHHCEGIK